jgi:hypothetical protein
VNNGVTAPQLLSQLYHPDEPAAIRAWMREMDVRWIVLRRDDEFWPGIVRGDPGHFTLRTDGGMLGLYEVRP